MTLSLQMSRDSLPLTQNFLSVNIAYGTACLVFLLHACNTVSITAIRNCGFSNSIANELSFVLGIQTET
jgi:hypothetical protein